MREVAALETESTLGQLLDLVENGGEVTITRHGKEVARLVPAKPAIGREEAHAVLRRIRARAEHLRPGPFDWAEWKAWRDEGRP